jgi:hypothetical protein
VLLHLGGPQARHWEAYHHWHPHQHARYSHPLLLLLLLLLGSRSPLCPTYSRRCLLLLQCLPARLRLIGKHPQLLQGCGGVLLELLQDGLCSFRV